MRILKSDWKAGSVTLLAEGPDDLWALSGILEPGDTLTGSTERKMKVGGSDEKSSVARRRMTLTVTVEKVEYDGAQLRALGVITDGPDDVPRGDHHSFALEQGSQVTVTKTQWPSYVRRRLEESTRADSGILVLLFDREDARLYAVTRRGVDELLRLKGAVAKKGLEEKGVTNFYAEIVASLKEHDARHRFASIVAGAPGFWREYLERELPPELKGKTVFTTISAVEKTAIRELVARPEVAKLLRENATLRELAIVEEALVALAKGTLAYGAAEVAAAVDQGNVAALLVSEAAIRAARAKGAEHAQRLEALMRGAEATRAEVHVIASDEPAAKLDGLGGVAALKRW